MKVLVSIPGSLYSRMMATIPPRQRSKLISKLLEDEVKKREQELYQAALAVEEDEELGAEMKDWDVTLGDVLNNGIQQASEGQRLVGQSGSNARF